MELACLFAKPDGASQNRGWGISDTPRAWKQLSQSGDVSPSVPYGTCYSVWRHANNMRGSAALRKQVVERNMGRPVTSVLHQATGARYCTLLSARQTRALAKKEISAGEWHSRVVHLCTGSCLCEAPTLVGRSTPRRRQGISYKCCENKSHVLGVCLDIIHRVIDGLHGCVPAQCFWLWPYRLAAARPLDAV